MSSFTVKALRENVAKTRHSHLKRLLGVDVEPWRKVLETGALSGRRLDWTLVTNFIMYVGKARFCYLLRTITDFPKLEARDAPRLLELRSAILKVVAFLKRSDISEEFKEHGMFVLLHVACCKIHSETRSAWFDHDDMSPDIESLLSFMGNWS